MEEAGGEGPPERHVQFDELLGRHLKDFYVFRSNETGETIPGQRRVRQGDHVPDFALMRKGIRDDADSMHRIGPGHEDENEVFLAEDFGEIISNPEKRSDHWQRSKQKGKPFSGDVAEEVQEDDDPHESDYDLDDSGETGKTSDTNDETPEFVRIGQQSEDDRKNDQDRNGLHQPISQPHKDVSIHAIPPLF